MTAVLWPHCKFVTAVARKRFRSFCQKCRWQVTDKHAYTLRVWLCMQWHGAWLYGVHRTCAETAAVSCGTSHASAVSTPLRWIFKKRAIKLVTHVEPHASAVSLLKRAENSAIQAIIQNGLLLPSTSLKTEYITLAQNGLVNFRYWVDQTPPPAQN